MKIELKKITVRELVDGYVDDAESGVRGYGGKLDIRPAYQREFVYKEKERNAVISTVMKGFPLNVMYWARNADGTFEVMDGQQRTISLCQYAAGDFAWGELDLALGEAAGVSARVREDARIGTYRHRHRPRALKSPALRAGNRARAGALGNCCAMPCFFTRARVAREKNMI